MSGKGYVDKVKTIKDDKKENTPYLFLIHKHRRGVMC